MKPDDRPGVSVLGILLLFAVLPASFGCSDHDENNDANAPATIASLDRDSDGLSDTEERAGWEIQIDEFGLGANVAPGLLTVRSVTSDPNRLDTDGDGLDDWIEYLILSDPRDSDTDGDGLTDFEEWNRWLTSPVSVDSDGDARGPNQDLAPNASLFDGNELSGRKPTSPSLADTDGDGKTDFEEFDDPVRSALIAEIPEIEISFEGDVDVRLNIQYAESVGRDTQYGSTMTQTQTTSSSRTDSDSYSHKFSLEVSANPIKLGKKLVERRGGASGGYEFGYTTTTSFTEETSVTAQQEYSRYVTDSLNRTETAASGSISVGLRLTNTGVSTYRVDGLGLTILQWQQELAAGQASGDFKTVGTLTPDLAGITLAPQASSPVIRLAAEQVDASLIKEFLASPTTLQYETAAFELTNQSGVNFEFLTEQTFSRTAFIEIDFGDGEIERYRVATNALRNADSSYGGITMRAIMRDILEIPYAVRENPSQPGQFVLDSVRDAESASATTGPLPEAFWVVGTTDDDDSGEPEDFEDIVVHAGDSLRLVYLRDRDQDGLADLTELLFGSSDENPDSDGPAGDGLDDRFETQTGWEVGPIEARDGSQIEAYQVFSDPTSADADDDGLTDDQELLARTDPNNADTDGDGLLDGFEVAYDEGRGEELALRAAPRLYVDQTTGIDCAVDTSAGFTWETSCSELRDALALSDQSRNSPEKADDIREIWVADGIYRPSSPGNRSASFRLGNLLALYGGFAGGETKRDQRNANPISNNTVLSGDLAQDDDSSTPPPRGDNSYHVVLAPSFLLGSGVSIDESAVMDGFTVASGNADGPAPGPFGGVTDHRLGGGIYIDNASPTLANVVFRLNSALLRGGGLYERNSHTQLSECLFIDNQAERGGGLSSRASSSQIRDCRFRQNAASVLGGGLHYEELAGDPTAGLEIRSSDFTANRSGDDAAGAAFEGGVHQISNTLIRLNDTAESDGDQNGGGLLLRNAGLLLSGSLIANNFSDDAGGGIWADSSSEIDIIESTIANNTADDSFVLVYGSECSLGLGAPGLHGRGGGIFSNSPRLFVVNSVFVGNDARTGDDDHADPSGDLGADCADDQEQIYPASASVETSCIEDLSWFAGSGNVNPGTSADTFAAHDLGNFRLKSGSRCIDAANPFADFDPFAPGFQQPPERDLANAPRIADGDGDGEPIIDMGAYEFQP